MSLQWTAVINEARRVLRDPVSRARYLATGLSRAPETGGPQLDPVFLEEMFELRMEADEDPAGVLPGATARRAALWTEIEAIFRRHEAGDGDLSAIEVRLARLKYLDNLVERASLES